MRFIALKGDKRGVVDNTIVVVNQETLGSADVFTDLDMKDIFCVEIPATTALIGMEVKIWVTEFFGEPKRSANGEFVDRWPLHLPDEIRKIDVESKMVFVHGKFRPVNDLRCAKTGARIII